MSIPANRQAIAQQAGGRSQIISIPAPLSGLNTRDPIDGMDPTFALQMENLFPESNLVRVRGGYETFCTNGGGSNLPLTLFNLVSGTTEYFGAVCNGNIYELQSGTPTSRTGTLTITNDRWVHTVFADSASPNTPYVLAVNGTDAPWKFSGGTNATAWTPTGPTLANLAWVFSFKNRVFAGEKNTRDFWYGALGAGQGTMTRFPLSGIRGAQGNILFMSAMTRDTGSGPDDYAVFVTTEGQVIVYAGTDPSDASAWSLVGVYQIPRPIQSRKAHAQIFGDVVIATERDYVFLSQALQQGGAFVLQPSAMAGAIQQAATLYGTNAEWQMIAWPEANQILCNIPTTSANDGAYIQHVFNAQTRAACTYTGWNVATMGRYDGKLYGTLTDKVVRLDSGRADDADDTPTAIEVRYRSAWWDLKSPQIKHVHAIRPFFRTYQPVRPRLQLATDFRNLDHAPVAQTGIIADTKWGDTAGVTTLWGDTAGTSTYWSGGLTGNFAQDRAWRLLSNRGTDFQLIMSVDLLNHAFEWVSTDYKLAGAGGF